MGTGLKAGFRGIRRPMGREFPHRPVLAVAGVTFHEGRVLLIRRGREPARGRWSIPGGVVRLGETLEEALRREIREETGVEVAVLGPVEVVERILPTQDGRIRFHYVIVDFACRYKGGVPRAASDAMDLRWVPMDRLDGVDLTKDTRRVIKKAYSHRDTTEGFDPLTPGAGSGAGGGGSPSLFGRRSQTPR